MTNQIIKVPRLSDNTIIDLFTEMSRNYGMSDINLDLGAAGTILLKVSDNLEVPELLQKATSTLIQSTSFNLPGFNISYRRGGNQEPKSPIYDDVTFSYNQQQSKLTSENRLEIIAKFSDHLGSFDPKRTLQSGLNEEQQQLLAIHSSTLERLEHLNEQLIRDSQKFRQNLEEDFQRRSDELEISFRDRSTALDSENERKQESLSSEKRDLEQKLKDIDDRENRHVRREIRKDILDEIRARTQSFSLTDGTNKLRSPVHWACVALMSVLLLANIFYAKEFSDLIKLNSSSISSLSIVTIKQLLISAGFGATAIFYIRWLNAWSSKHAEAEFNIKQFQLDIERASWVVETALEWQDSKDNIIPHELLEPITRGLFADGKEKKDELHPADQLASALMGTAAKVKLRTGDSDIEIDGKKLNSAK
jgi:hypothetical protein